MNEQESRISRFSQIVERLKEISSKLLIDLNDHAPILARASGTPKILVVGEFNAGKSSLINSALGDTLLPVGVTPTTSLVTTLSHGPFKITIKPLGLKDPISIDPGKKEAVGYGIPGNDFDWRKFGDLLTNPENIDKFEQVFITNPMVPPNLSIIDTPGINDISKARAEIVFGMIPSADIVVFVISAIKPFSESEKLFLEEKILAGDLKKLVIAVNRMDEIDRDERQDLLDDITSSVTDSVNKAYDRINSMLGEKLYMKPEIRVFPTCATVMAPIKGRTVSKNIGFALSDSQSQQSDYSNQDLWKYVMDLAGNRRSDEVNAILHHYLRRGVLRLSKAIDDVATGESSDRETFLKKLEKDADRLEQLRTLLSKCEIRIRDTESMLKQTFKEQIERAIQDILSTWRLQRDPATVNTRLKDLYEYIVTKMKATLEQLYAELDHEFHSVIDDKRFLEQHELNIEYDFSDLPYKIISSINFAYLAAIFFGMNVGLAVGAAWFASQIIANKRSVKQYFMTATVSEESVLQIKSDLIARVDLEVEYAVDFVRQSIVQRIDVIQSDMRAGVARLTSPRKYRLDDLRAELEQVKVKVNGFLCK